MLTTSYRIVHAELTDMCLRHDLAMLVVNGPHSGTLVSPDLHGVDAPMGLYPITIHNPIPDDD